MTNINSKFAEKGDFHTADTPCQRDANGLGRKQMSKQVCKRASKQASLRRSRDTSRREEWYGIQRVKVERSRKSKTKKLKLVKKKKQGNDDIS